MSRIREAGHSLIHPSIVQVNVLNRQKAELFVLFFFFGQHKCNSGITAEAMFERLID